MVDRVIDAVNKWIETNQEDETKYWQIQLLKYLCKNACGKENAKSIDKIRFHLNYPGGKSKFQHLVLVPLKKQSRFFVGSSNRGIYLVISEIDAQKAASFYNKRISEEQTHLDNLINVMNSYGVVIH